MTATWHAHIITLFPQVFPGVLDVSLAGRARQDRKWDYTTYDLREFGLGRHRNVDDAPAGGGAGMVIRPDCACAAIDHVRETAAAMPSMPLIMFTPRGMPFTQSMAQELAQGEGAILFCPRFEGIDERVITSRNAIEISLGDFILSGGEPAALCLMDAVIRLRPNVLGNAQSHIEESFTTGLLEYPQYTRPADFEGHKIPDILTSGNHAKIAAWRQKSAESATKTRRPDLWRAYLAQKK